MKILQVTRGYGRLLPEENPGAIESVIFNISKCLSSMGHEVTIIDRKFDKSPVQYVDGIKIVRLDTDNIDIKGNRIFDLVSSELDFIKFAMKVRKHIKESEYDIVHVHSTVVGSSLATLNKDIAKRMVYTSHNSMWSLQEGSVSYLDVLFKYLDVYLMKKVGKVIALGHNLKLRYVSKGVASEKIFVAHNGVDTDLFNPSLDMHLNSADIDYDQIFSDKKFNILFVGRMDKVKGIDYLMKAMDIIVNGYKCSNVQCLVVGPANVISVDSNQDTDTIFKYVNDKNIEDNVIFLGELSIDDLKSVYNMCDIFILPSIAEAAPLTILEAMAFGKPVICTNVGAVSEYVIDGVNGLLIDAKEENQLAEKIKYIYDNPHIKDIIGKNNSQSINKFDWKKTCIDIESIYKNHNGNQS